MKNPPDRKAFLTNETACSGHTGMRHITQWCLRKTAAAKNGSICLFRLYILLQNI